MGRALAAVCLEAGDCRVVAGVARDAGGVVPGFDEAPIVRELAAVAGAFDVVVDFSSPDGAVAAAEACREAGRPLVSGTTGLSAAQVDTLATAGRKIPVIFAPNMSAGVTLLLDLVHRAARALGEEADVEILEAHHRYKKDAPSGTALRLGEAVAEGWSTKLSERAIFDRGVREAARETGEIGFASLRSADIVGEHTVLLGMAGERLELTHRATDRAIFARGALRAARWVVQKEPGLFDMRDVLGL